MCGWRWTSCGRPTTKVKVAQEGLELSENELAQARRRYAAGVANSVEVTDAQTRLERARDNQTAALYNYNLARIDLAQAMGQQCRRKHGAVNDTMRIMSTRLVGITVLASCPAVSETILVS